MKRNSELPATVFSPSGWFSIIRELMQNIYQKCILNEELPYMELVFEVVGGKQIIKISDRGKDISKETLEKSFLIGFTTSPKQSPLSGAGLGFPLIKLFVEFHLGKLSVESEEGKGTSVIISLPDIFSGSASSPLALLTGRTSALNETKGASSPISSSPAEDNQDKLLAFSGRTIEEGKIISEMLKVKKLQSNVFRRRSQFEIAVQHLGIYGSLSTANAVVITHISGRNILFLGKPKMGKAALAYMFVSNKIGDAQPKQWQLCNHWYGVLLFVEHRIDQLFVMEFPEYDAQSLEWINGTGAVFRGFIDKILPSFVTEHQIKPSGKPARINAIVIIDDVANYPSDIIKDRLLARNLTPRSPLRKQVANRLINVNRQLRDSALVEESLVNCDTIPVIGILRPQLEPYRDFLQRAQSLNQLLHQFLSNMSVGKQGLNWFSKEKSGTLFAEPTNTTFVLPSSKKAATLNNGGAMSNPQEAQQQPRARAQAPNIYEVPANHFPGDLRMVSILSAVKSLPEFPKLFISRLFGGAR